MSMSVKLLVAALSFLAAGYTMVVGDLIIEGVLLNRPPGVAAAVGLVLALLAIPLLLTVCIREFCSSWE